MVPSLSFWHLVITLKQQMRTEKEQEKQKQAFEIQEEKKKSNNLRINQNCRKRAT
jgi:hypothetical protein